MRTGYTNLGFRPTLLVARLAALFVALLVTLFVAGAAVAPPAYAARRLTAEQLQQTLLNAQAAHRKDDDLALQLSDLELASRVSPAAERQLLVLSPGPQTASVLRALMDGAVFLDPGPSEILAQPAPDFATQKAIIAKTVHYVARTLPTLPDFVATRSTEHFDDKPETREPGGWPMRDGLHSSGTSRISIAYRDGRETDDPSIASVKQPEMKKVGQTGADKDTKPVATGGLSSWGEFGPILGIVLIDAAKGKLNWARWEQIEGKPVAVFQFAVDRPASHYNVQYCCVRDGEVVGSSYGGGPGSPGGPGRGQTQVSKGMFKTATSVFQQVIGYHGHLTLDPDTGTILRIDIEADLKSDDPIQRAAMMVEYGSVKIGDNAYICPIRSVSESVSHEPYQASATSLLVEIAELQINEVTFTGYHRFGSESTLIADAPPSSSQPEDVPATSPSNSNAASLSVTGDAAPSTSTAVPPTENLASAVPSASAPSAAPPAPAPAESDQEILVKPVDGLLGTEASTTVDNSAANAGSSSSFTLKVTTRLVDIGLVATDKRGKPIADLKQDEIEIYDNGRRQQLASFLHPNAGANAPASSESSQTQAEPSDPGTFTNATTVIRAVQDAPDLLILLMDESHLAFQDLNRARGEVLRFLKATRPDSRVAAYSVSEHGFHVIQDVTQDHALVMSKLTTWMPNAQAVSQAQALDRRIRQQFDTVHNASDLNYVNGNENAVPDYITSTDPELRLMGQNPLRSALEAMVALARHFSSVPGHKSMAWITGDSVLADWEDQAVGIEKGGKQMDAALMHTREALNNAHIALYAVDASAIPGDAVDSSLENRNVQLNQAAQDNIAAGGGGARVSNGGAGRIQAQMQQDTHGIQGPVRQLAESTGGRAINKGGDLKATLDSIDQESAGLYEVGFNPDTQADGKYHTLQLRIPNRKDVKLRYRAGYLYSEESTSTKDRFQQAVWSPQDASSLTLSADVVSTDDSGSSMIKLRIDFPSVALQKTDGKDSHWMDQLYIFVAQRDDAAQKAEVSGDTLRLSLKQATYESGMPAGIPYRRVVNVKSKLGSVRVIVVDGNSGKIGSVTLPASALHP